MEHSVLNWISIKSLPSVFKEPSSREGRKIEILKRREHTKKTKPSKESRTQIHMNSQRLWQHAQSLHRTKTEEVPALKDEGNTSL